MEVSDYDVVVVGAGLFGICSALELGKLGKKVLVIDRRAHIGGNSYSQEDSDTGIEVHLLGYEYISFNKNGEQVAVRIA